MEQIKIVIIEDEFFAANHLKDLLEDLDYIVVGIFHSGEDFISSTDWDFDIAIVDIFLSKEMLGLDVAEHLQKHQRPFIFLTANQDTQTLKRAARLNPLGYITKPFNPNDVVATIEIFSNQQSKDIELRGKNGIEKVNPNDILFIKSDGAYIEIQTTKKLYLQRKLLKEIMTDLPPFFAKVHRSFVVNINYIDQRSATELQIKDYKIPVSRSYKNF